MPKPIQDEDVKWIESRMRKIVSGNHPFTVKEITAAEGREIFKDQAYKLELIEDLVKGRTNENGEQIAEPAEHLTIYEQDGFVDLCRGPHVANTREINAKAFSIRIRPPPALIGVVMRTVSN
ncbi:hypothetical protein MASR2M15_29280 [Anaerolineales bacterium]